MDNLWILVQIISSAYGFIIALTLSKWRFSKRTTIIAASSFVLTVAAYNFFAVKNLSYLLTDYPILDFVYRISNVLVAIIVACVLVRQKTEQIIFTFLSACACILVVDTIAITLRIVFGKYLLELIFEILIYTSMLLLVMKVRRPFLEIVEYMEKKLWQLCIIPALLLVCFFLQISIPTPLEQNYANIPVALLLSLIAPAFYGVCYMLFRITNSQNMLERNVMAMNIYTSRLEHQNDIAAQNEKKYAIFRHDMRHIGQMILAFLDAGDVESVRKLLYDTDLNMQAMESSGAIRSFTGHKFLDTTLQYYINLAKDSDINIDIGIRTDKMGNVNVDITELSVVLSNALENAFNACMRLPAGMERTVRLTGKQRGRQYFFEIVNTCTGDVCFDKATGLPVNNEAGHGIGSQSIAYFAEKYGVALQYQLEGNLFRMQMLIEKNVEKQNIYYA